MAAELADLVDGEGNVHPNLRCSIIKYFCKSPVGSKWFYLFTMPMVSCEITELVDAIHNDNLGMTMPSVIDIYYNKEAKYPKLPWDEVTDVNDSTLGSGDELFDRGDEGVKSALVIEVSQESVLDTSDIVAVLNLEETIVQGVKGLIGDQLGVDPPNVPVATARGFKGSMDWLRLRVSGDDQASVSGLPAGMDVVPPPKPFGTIVGLGERSEHATRLDAPLHFTRDGLATSYLGVFPVRSFVDLCLG